MEEGIGGLVGQTRTEKAAKHLTHHQKIALVFVHLTEDMKKNPITLQLFLYFFALYFRGR